MRKLALIILMSLGCAGTHKTPLTPAAPVPLRGQFPTLEVETIVDETGDVVITKTARERTLVWMQMFANGRFQRFPELAGIAPDPAFSTKWNGRITSDLPDSLLTVLKNDFQNSTIFAKLPADEIEDGVLIYERWPWGNKERKEFYTMTFNDITQARLDSIRQDSVRWQLPPLKMRNGLNLNVTLRQLNNNPNVPQRIKTWFQNNVLGKDGITANTTLWEVLTEHRKKVKMTWLKHPFFRNKLRAAWLKRR